MRLRLLTAALVVLVAGACAPGARIAADSLSGKFSAESLVQLAPSTLLISFTGYLDGDARRSGWADRSTDGGQHWDVLPANGAERPTSSVRDSEAPWANRPAPCTGNPFGGSVTRGRGSLWLVCYEQPQRCGPRGFLNVVYQSTDDGTMWKQRSPASLTCTPRMTLYPVTISTAWATTSGIETGAVLRTVDGGRSWHQALAASNDPPLAPEAALGMSAGQFAFVGLRLVGNNESFVFYLTRDGGRTWTTAQLPVPARLGSR